MRGTDHRGRPYHEQGDPAMYTAASLAAREALRSAPEVIDAVARFSRLYQVRVRVRASVRVRVTVMVRAS